MTSCAVSLILGLAYAADDIGIVLSYGEDKSKSFTRAHKPDC